MKSIEPICCGLCGREFPRQALTKHHCMPKAKGGTIEDVELLCSQCHSMVHCTYTNGTLANEFASLAELRQAEELQKYIRWVRKQATTRRKRNAKRNDRR